MNLRAIINIEITQPWQAEAPRGEGEWERWGWALLLTALLHAGVLCAVLSMPRALPKVARPEEPELVLLAFVPPHAAARRAVTAVPPAPAPVQRKARARIERPHVMPHVPAPLVEPRPPVPEEVLPDTHEQAAAPAEPVEAEAGSEAVTGVVAGIVDSAMTTKATASLGVTGNEAVGLNQVLRPPEVLEQAQPQYPRQAKSRGIEGLVLVRVIVGTDGRIEPEHTRIIRSVPALDSAAVAAVSQWRFSPALGRHGRVVRVILDVPFQFSLK